MAAPHGTSEEIKGANGSDDQVSSNTPSSLHDAKVVEVSDYHEKGFAEVKTDHVPGLDIDLPEYDIDNDGAPAVIEGHIETAKDLTTQVLHVQDNPNESAWTFRTFFLGIGFSIFGSVLQEIFFFKPQTIFVSVVFLTVLAYVFGELMSFIIPRRGWFRYLNPGPFCAKEHAAITIMASAASQAAQSTQALAAQALYYGGFPSEAAGVFVTISSQLFGFGLAGLLRDVLVYPTKMLWPITLPVATLIESLHRDKRETKRKLKVFYIGFVFMFFWEILPEWMFTTLTGVSIFCLANQHSLVFTNIFGGSTGNEGLGLLSVCFDWNYIVAVFSPMWFPLNSTFNALVGVSLCYILFASAYYANIWDSYNLPFLSEDLFSQQSNSTNYVIWNQTAALNSQFEFEPALVEELGTPQITSAFVIYLITSNMGITAAFTHMFIWNRDDLKAGWSWLTIGNLRKIFTSAFWQPWKNQETAEERLNRKQADPLLDPHYKLMLKNGYPESPNWWWFTVGVISFAIGIACLYGMHSTLPWWGYIVACIFTFILLLVLGAQMGITGFQFNTQPICQMVAGYLFPHKPLANLYFTCYTYNTLQQGQLLAKDMKLAQYAHLPPHCTFVCQIIGCIVGACFNFLLMRIIVTHQTQALLGIQGSNVWSGQNIQIFNTQAVAWSLAPQMFSIGAKYQWVTIGFLVGFLAPLPFWLAYKYIAPWKAFSYINTSIILWYCGNLYTGVNSSFTSFFIVGFLSQWYFRKYKPELFVKYNYLISAAFDGGAQVMVFILTFAVQGGSGNQHPFPVWGGNPNLTVHNPDYCLVNQANFNPS